MGLCMAAAVVWWPNTICPSMCSTSSTLTVVRKDECSHKVERYTL